MKQDCIIIGGGIAGLQAAIMLGRYDLDVLVADAGFGRSTLCRSYHNVLGWPDGVSGEELRRLGREQASRYGVRFVQDEIVEAAHDREEGGFRLMGRGGQEYAARTLLLATGLTDRLPDIEGLKPCLGRSVYVCPDCDGYEVRGKRTIVLGAGDPGAAMAVLLSERTGDLIYVNHERTAMDGKWAARLEQCGIKVRSEPIEEVLTYGDGWFCGVRLAGGATIDGERGFVAFGGNQVRSNLAMSLGVERLENRHIVTDPRTKQTNVDGVWAAGDVAVHSEQLTIAMGEGAQAAIWIHKALREARERKPETVGV